MGKGYDWLGGKSGWKDEKSVAKGSPQGGQAEASPQSAEEMSLSVPPVLQSLFDRMARLTQMHQMAERISVIREMIRRVEGGEGDRVFWAMLQGELGTSLWQSPFGDHAANLEEAITHLTATGEVFTREREPELWAGTQMNLGILYRSRVNGDRTTNLERAIEYLHAALEIFTQIAFPKEWALAQMNLGIMYLDRISGDREENLDRAIEYLRAALLVFTPQTFADQWAVVQNNLGTVYHNRMSDNRAQDLERAIECYTAALQIRTRAASPEQWAITQNNLGNTYVDRIEGNRAENLRQAIACFAAALEVYQRDVYPEHWARLHHNVGDAYSNRAKERTAEDLEHAIVHYRAALDVRTLAAFPFEHQKTSVALAEALAWRGEWEHAYIAFADALQAETLLLELGGGAHHVDDILKAHRNASSGAAYALVQLGRVEEAILIHERGRARTLARARQLDSADPNQIGDSMLRQQFSAAHARLVAAQRDLNTPFPRDTPDEEKRKLRLARGEAFADAKADFDRVVTTIREQRDPADFLDDTVKPEIITRACARGGNAHALLFLISTLWGGMAFMAQVGEDGDLRCKAIALPVMTSDFVSDEIIFRVASKDDRRIIGGYGNAQGDHGFILLQHQFPGATFAEKAHMLHDACVAAARQSALDDVAQAVVHDEKWHEAIHWSIESAQKDPARVETLRTLVHHVNYAFLLAELRATLRDLSAPLAQPLARWLRSLGVTHATIIPGGILAGMPILAVPLDPSLPVAKWETLGDAVTLSCAPSARSLLPAEITQARRSGFAGVGNPQPDDAPLKWGEAEPLTLRQIWQNAARPGATTVQIQDQAKRQFFLDLVRTVRVFEASCHGMTNFDEYLDSALHLADGTVTLADAFNNRCNLHGLRLLILSACQTAAMNPTGTLDEVRSLAAGMVQAGAEAVLGSFWSVNDLATYLLMCRFAQEWFPVMDQEPPALALARAQRWLRSVSYAELARWQNATPLPNGIPLVQASETLGADADGVVAVRSPGMAHHLRDLWYLEAMQRYPPEKAQEIIQARMSRRGEPDPSGIPFSDPFFWAAFQITGW
jgi:CHAT domain-containing protein